VGPVLCSCPAVMSTGTKEARPLWSGGTHMVHTCCTRCAQQANTWVRDVHGMCTGCARDVHGMCTGCARDVHGMCTGCVHLLHRGFWPGTHRA